MIAEKTLTIALPTLLEGSPLSPSAIQQIEDLLPWIDLDLQVATTAGRPSVVAMDPNDSYAGDDPETIVLTEASDLAAEILIEATLVGCRMSSDESTSLRDIATAYLKKMIYQIETHQARI